MKGIKKIVLSVFVLLTLFSMFHFPVEVHAEIKTAELVTTDRQQDLVVMFTFDKEIVELTLVSPDGTKYTSKSEQVETSKGDLWMTWRIKDAMAGTWSVEYDLKTNSSIDYSIIEDEHGIWIQYVNIREQLSDRMEVVFKAEGQDTEQYYNYVLKAIDENSNASTQLASGSGKSGEEQTSQVSLTGLSNGDYKLQLYVYYNEGDAEIFDTMLSDVFSHVNPYTPAAVENFKVIVDSAQLTCTVDWSKCSVNGSEYMLVINADGEAVFESSLDSNTRNIDVMYPSSAKQLDIIFSYKNSSIWSNKTTKTIMLEEEYLKIAEGDVTNSGQVTLLYLTSEEEKTLSVTVNEKSGKYLIAGEESLSFSLQEGINTIYAGYAVDETLELVVNKEIYYDLYPPTITLYDNIDGKKISSSSFDILGAVTDASKLLLNGNECEIKPDGSFSIPVDLKSGENVYTLEAIDVNGNSALMSITLHRAGGFTDRDSNYTPLIISLIVSLVMGLVALLFMKRKDSADKTKEKEKAKPRKRWLYIVLFVLFILLDIVAAAAWFMLSKYMRTIEFLELAEQSMKEAIWLIKIEGIIAIAVPIMTGVIVFIFLIIFLRIKWKKRKQTDKNEKVKTKKKRIKKSKMKAAEDTAADDSRICPQCGATLKPEDKFCTSCGMKISDETEGELSK